MAEQTIDFCERILAEELTPPLDAVPLTPFMRKTIEKWYKERRFLARLLRSRIGLEIHTEPEPEN